MFRKTLYIFCVVLCCCGLSACGQKKQAPSVLDSAGFYQIDPRLITPVANARFTLVEFFDYRCEACAAAYPNIKQFQAVDPQVQVIYRELPFLGPASEFAARAAIASALQGKYAAMHDALMTAGPSLNEDMVLSIAKELNLNMTTLSEDMQSPFVNRQLFENSLLASKIDLQSTPMYLFARTSLQKDHNLQVEKALVMLGVQTSQQLKDKVIELNA